MTRLRSHPIVFGLVIWLVLGAFATLLIWGADGSNRSLGTALRDHGAIITGKVTGTDPADHNSVSYSFVAHGKTYRTGYFGDGPQGVASELSVGQNITIVYDSQDPTQSCYCDVAILAKQADWWRTLIAGLFLASVISVVVTIALTRRKPHTASAATSRPQ